MDYYHPHSCTECGNPLDLTYQNGDRQKYGHVCMRCAPRKFCSACIEMMHLKCKRCYFHDHTEPPVWGVYNQYLNPPVKTWSDTLWEYWKAMPSWKDIPPLPKLS